MKIASVSIPTPDGTHTLTLEAGRSTIFVGANGSGKTRLGVHIENSIDEKSVRRIAAHRSLVMSDKLQAMSLDRALRGLEVGYPDQGGSRHSHRWQDDPAVALLSDYDYLMQSLFAEQSRTAVEHLKKHRSDSGTRAPDTVLSRLSGIWQRLLPHRLLHLLELGVEVLPPGVPQGKGYSGSQMSDGERVIFYLLGHCLIASEDAVMVIDEPELHVHKAILGRLWDLIESERPDCSFVYITHDLDFDVARPTAAKLVVRAYSADGKWEIEGERGSVDATIYRMCTQTFLFNQSEVVMR